MPGVHRSVPGLIIAALLGAPAVLAGPGEARAQGPRPPHAGPIPLRHHVGGTAVEVPITTRGLGWQPRPIRVIHAYLIEERAGDERDEFGIPRPPPGPAGGGARLASRVGPVKAECYDLWIYGDLSRERRIFWMLCMLSEKIEKVGRRGRSDAELEKLILAGRGDIKRLIDRIEATRPAFEAVRYDSPGCSKLLESLVPLSGEFQRGPFGEGSLFAKVLAKILADREAAGGAGP